MKRFIGVVLCTAALFWTTGVAQASILQNAVTNGLNTINDVDAERYIPVTGNPMQPTFMLGDMFQFVLVMENITNATHLNVPLGTATGAGANYQLGAVGSFTVTGINDPSHVPGAAVGNIDISLTGTVSIYESNAAANLVDFTIDTFNQAATKISVGTTLLATLGQVGNDFLTSFDIQGNIAGIPPFPGIEGRGGFTVTDVALGFSIVPDGTSINHRDFVAAGAPFVNTNHDVTLIEHLFLNQGTNTTEFPFFTDTTIQFTVQGIVPEPLSLLVWTGLATIGGVLAWKKRK